MVLRKVSLPPADTSSEVAVDPQVKHQHDEPGQQCHEVALQICGGSCMCSRAGWKVCKWLCTKASASSLVMEYARIGMDLVRWG